MQTAKYWSSRLKHCRWHGSGSRPTAAGSHLSQTSSMYRFQQSQSPSPTFPLGLGTGPGLGAGAGPDGADGGCGRKSLGAFFGLYPKGGSIQVRGRPPGSG
jgi:hypothetical protein